MHLTLDRGSEELIQNHFYLNDMFAGANPENFGGGCSFELG